MGGSIWNVADKYSTIPKRKVVEEIQMVSEIFFSMLELVVRSELVIESGFSHVYCGRSRYIRRTVNFRNFRFYK